MMLQLLLLSFGELALRGRTLRVLLLLALVVIVALLDGKLLGTVRILAAQIGLTLTGRRWVRLAYLAGCAAATPIAV